MTLWFVFVALVIAACEKTPTVKVPTESELEELCPKAFEAATVGCASIAVKYCAGYETLNECPRGEDAREECRALRQKELDKCR